MVGGAAARTGNGDVRRRVRVLWPVVSRRTDGTRRAQVKRAPGPLPLSLSPSLSLSPCRELPRRRSTDGKQGWQGMWRRGVLGGTGRLWLPDGEAFTGDFVAGLREGAGLCVYADGSRFEGAWRGGRRNGQGTCVYVLATAPCAFLCVWRCVMSPVCVRARSCLASRFASKVEYSGKWVADLPNGRGVCVYPQGGRYDGMWRNGLRHGPVRRQTHARTHARTVLSHACAVVTQGRFAAPDGSVFDGLWRHDCRHGEGKLVSADGSVVTGTVRRAGCGLGAAWLQRGCVSCAVGEGCTVVNGGGRYVALPGGAC